MELDPHLRGELDTTNEINHTEILKLVHA